MNLPPKVNRLLIRIRDSSVLKLVLLVIVILSVYWQDFIVVAADSLNELSNYLIAIPFLLIILLYKNRKVIKTRASLERTRGQSDVIIGCLLLMAAFLIYWIGSYTFLPLEYHLVSLPIFITGTLILLYSRNILPPLIFPLVTLLFLEPFPSYLTSYLGSAFTYWSAAASLNLLSLFRVPAYFTIISGTPVIAINSLDGNAISFGVTTECSGIYSLTGFAVFAAFAGYIAIGSISKRIALFVLGFPVVYLLNIFRVTAIVAAGYQLGAGTALQVFHMFAGSTLIFLTTFVLLIAGERFWHLRFLPDRTKNTCLSCNSPLSLNRGFCEQCSRIVRPLHLASRKSWIVPVIIIMIVITAFLSIQIPVYAITKGPPSFTMDQLAANPANQSILPQIPSWRYQYVYRDPLIERTLGLDLALSYVYATNTSSPETRVNVLIEMSGTPIHHTWESSLVLFPTQHNKTAATIFNDYEIQLSTSPFLPGKFLTFVQPSSPITETVVFWNQQIPIQSAVGFEMEYAQFSLLVVDDDLNASGLISRPFDSVTSQTHLKNLLLPFAHNIINYWRPQQTHALLTNVFGQKGLLIMGVFGFTPIISFCGAELAKARSRTLSNRKLCSRLLSKSEKDVLDAVSLIEKSNGINSIAMISKQLGQPSVTSNTLTYSDICEILEHAEKARLVRRVIKTINNEPYLSWKVDF